jgi:hypothetical protein
MPPAEKTHSGHLPLSSERVSSHSRGKGHEDPLVFATRSTKLLERYCDLDYLTLDKDR